MNIFLKDSEIKIIGFARKFDFAIRLTEPNVYKKLKKDNSKVLPVYAHEWTHYYQFLSTSIGNLLAEVELNLFLTKKLLIYEASQKLTGRIKLPLINSIQKQEEIYSNSKIKPLLILLKNLAKSRKILDSSWENQLEDTLVDLKFIKKQKPLKLIVQEGQLLFNSKKGEKKFFNITATQLLEHSAIANELILTKGIFPKKYLNQSYLDYFAFYLFLYQEEFIDISKAQNGDYKISINGSIDSDPLEILVFMQMICQISLMLYIHKAYFKPEDSEYILMNIKSIEKIHKPELYEKFIKSSARTFLTFLRNFKVITNFLKRKRRSNGLEIIDQICSNFGFEKYSYMLEYNYTRLLVGKEKMKNDFELSGNNSKQALQFLTKLVNDGVPPTDRQIELLNNFGDIFSSYFFKGAIASFTALMNNPELSWAPLLNADLIQSPYIYLDSKEGERRIVIKFPWQTNPQIAEVPYSIVRYGQGANHLAHKILFEDNLSCYSNNCDSQTAEKIKTSIGCPDFDNCFKKNKTSLLDFCTYSDWREIALLEYETLIFSKNIKTDPQ